MHKYQVFVCVNHRTDDACCAASGGKGLLAKCKAEVAALGLEATVVVKPTGCIDRCANGPALVIYEDKALAIVPERYRKFFMQGVMYGPVTQDDIGSLLESHCGHGLSLERLKLSN
ncbi:MAG: putative Ferredoxin, 2Fe-2S [Cyanobacteria bacterium RYN_339]|nr:putative Ferredoxin, 2Fe-2S [Cyanobacteria bacterium RYN_339]